MVNKNVLLIIETSFYLENCHFGCGYKRDVLQNETYYKTGCVRTRDFTVCIEFDELDFFPSLNLIVLPAV